MSAIGRAFSRIWYYISFRFLSATESIERNPQIAGMRFDDVIREKAAAAERIKNAVGDLMANQELLKLKLKDIRTGQGGIRELTDDKEGAFALAGERKNALKGKKATDDQILQDGEFMQLMAAYNDASTTLAEREARASDLGEHIGSLQTSIDQYVVQAQELKREVERLRSERYELVASMELAQQFDQINSVLAGISTAGADERLAELRRVRAEAEGRAKASERIAGVDVTVQRQKLREAARKHVTNNELLRRLGMKRAEAPAAEAPAAVEKTSQPLPEA